MKQLKKTLLTLVALLAVTTGAWAQTETLLTTITPTAQTTYSETTPGVVTVTLSNVRRYSSTYGWLWGSSGSVTVEAKEGYTITQCVFKQNAKTPVTITTSPFVITFNEYGFCVQNGDMDGVTSIEVYGYAPAAPSGPEVTWTAASKTGTFTMPGGNVTLEPEYYPQATAAEGAVTAATDVKATTDAPLVTIDETKLTGAKKLMYYVSTDATAPAYDAVGWTDQLPTAENYTEAATLNVWYYPVGTDEGDDEATATYSDGDICSTALTVTLGAAPTYAVTFADDLTEPDKWTASPATDVTKGTAVTVTYTGSKKVIGVKAEKKAAAPTISFSKQTWYEAESAPANFISVSQADAKAAADAEKTQANAPGYVCIYALEGGQYKWIDSHGRTGQNSSIANIANMDAWDEVYECNNAGYNNCIWFTVEPTN